MYVEKATDMLLVNQYALCRHHLMQGVTVCRATHDSDVYDWSAGRLSAVCVFYELISTEREENMMPAVLFFQ